jgi:hypothetical protein
MKVSKKLIWLLKQMRVTGVSIKNNTATVYLYGKALPKHRVKIEESVPNVASWKNGIEMKNIIRIDDDIAKTKRWIKSLIVHELVEKWLMYYSIWKLPYHIAHEIAEHVEKKWFVENYGKEEWKEYMKRVDEVWEKENRGVEYVQKI